MTAAVRKGQMLEKMLEELRANVCVNISSLFFITNVTESKDSSIYVMIQKKGGNVRRTKAETF